MLPPGLSSAFLSGPSSHRILMPLAFRKIARLEYPQVLATVVMRQLRQEGSSLARVVQPVRLGQKVAMGVSLRGLRSAVGVEISRKVGLAHHGALVWDVVDRLERYRGGVPCLRIRVQPEKIGLAARVDAVDVQPGKKFRGTGRLLIEVDPRRAGEAVSRSGSAEGLRRSAPLMVLIPRWLADASAHSHAR